MAERQADIVTREQLAGLGLTPAAIRANIAARRWAELGVHCIVIHCGPLSAISQRWAAVLEAGPRAFLDGESSLVAAGLANFRSERLRVSVPRGGRIRHRDTAVDIRQTRRWCAADVIADPVPRARTPVAAVRAALWAKSDRQAELIVTMVVQQRLCDLTDIAAALLTVKRDRRRALISTLLLDLSGGAGSLGELDVLRGCRARGLPEPDQQVVRRSARGVYYLDFRWAAYALALEVDGIQHGWVQNAIGDALRHNTIALSGDTVLRLPVLGLRLCPEEFFAQIEAALAARGWRRTPVAS